jgi:hypothetical protein
MPYAVCRMPYALYTTGKLISPPQRVATLCPKCYAPMPLCRMPYALCPMPYAVCPMPYAVCSVLYALCPMPYVLCPMPYALCRMPRLELISPDAILEGEITHSKMIDVFASSATESISTFVRSESVFSFMLYAHRSSGNADRGSDAGETEIKLNAVHPFAAVDFNPGDMFSIGEGVIGRQVTITFAMSTGHLLAFNTILGRNSIKSMYSAI